MAMLNCGIIGWIGWVERETYLITDIFYIYHKNEKGKPCKNDLPLWKK
jgi:hypothetical protein